MHDEEFLIFFLNKHAQVKGFQTRDRAVTPKKKMNIFQNFYHSIQKEFSGLLKVSSIFSCRGVYYGNVP